MQRKAFLPYPNLHSQQKNKYQISLNQPPTLKQINQKKINFRET